MSPLETISVLVAVKSDALARVIRHLLHDQAGISGIDFADSKRGLIEQTVRLRPGLIIINSQLLGGDAAGAALVKLRQANPHSKLILTCNLEEFSRSMGSDIVDACVLDETLVRELPAIARRLTNRPARASVERWS